MVDHEKKPAMGEIYAAMHNANDSIKKKISFNVGQYIRYPTFGVGCYAPLSGVNYYGCNIAL
jgi:hypothetical protein